MTLDIDNPYASPAVGEEEPRPLIRWRIVPAAASFLIGVASFGFGLAAVAMMSIVLWTQQANETLGDMIAGCSLYLGFGAFWMLAGWYYWKRHYRRALIANGLGALIPGILIAILGT